jgi:hypothetical protein
MRSNTIDVLPSLKLRGFLQRQLQKHMSFRWVSDSLKLPRGISLVFAFKIPTVGNFTVTNQPPIPPGLTASPKADTARPAAKTEYMGYVAKMQVEKQGYRLQRIVPYIPDLKDGVLRNVG